MQKIILLLTANPKDTLRLRLDEEASKIDKGLQRAKYRDRFQLIQKWAVQPTDIRRAMLDCEPQIVHFSGHGSDESGIILEDSNGTSKLVNPDALAELFELFPKVECVVLNACYSEVQADAIAKHVNYVIGMSSDNLKDDSAIEFATAFYDAIGAEQSVEFAYRLGCNALKMAGTPEHLVPILKKKTTDGSILDSKNSKFTDNKEFSYLIRPGSLLRAFGSRWNVNECVEDITLSGQVIGDYIIVTGQSFMYDIAVVKIESSLARPFTATGDFSAELNTAFNYINRCFEKIDSDRKGFFESIASKMKSGYGASQLVGLYRERLTISGKIIIGRRAMLSEADNERRATLYKQSDRSIEITNYDRLLDADTRL